MQGIRSLISYEGSTADELISAVKAEGFSEVVCIGLDSGLEEIKNITRFEKIFVIAPSGVRAGKFLKEKFGLDVEAKNCPLPEKITEGLKAFSPEGKTLVIHQQYAANTVRDMLGGKAVCGTFFGLDEAAAREGDFHIKDEEDFAEKAKGFDTIIADISLKRALPDHAGKWFDLPHFAVSGRLY